VQSPGELPLGDRLLRRLQMPEDVGESLGEVQVPQTVSVQRPIAPMKSYTRSTISSAGEPELAARLAVTRKDS
jgi:hypothetical protein